MRYNFLNPKILIENEIVSLAQLAKMDIFFNNYFSYIENELSDYNNGNFDLTDLSSIVLLISECYDISIDKNRLEKITDRLLIILKDQLYDDKIIKPLSFFGGLADIAFSLKLISEKNSKYKNFYKNINQIIFSQLDIYTTSLEKYKKELAMPHFDFISGASGVLKYLLEFNREDIKNFNVVKNLVKYLHSLIGIDKTYDSIRIPNWYVKHHNNFPLDRERFPEGSINYSLSHGIVSVVGVLQEASEKWGLSYLNKSLETISNELWKIRGEDNGIPYWPGMIPLEDYKNNDYKLAYENKRMSWCYGSLGILLILEKQFSLLGNTDRVKEIEDSIIGVANMPIDKYEFESPTICHGFSGAIVMLNSKYKISKNEVIRKQLQNLMEKVYSYYSEVATGFNNIEVFYKNGEKKTVIETSHYLLSGTPGILLSLLFLIKPTHFQRHLLM